MYIFTMYTVRNFRQGNFRMYGHIQCVYMILANTEHVGPALMMMKREDKTTW